MKINITPPRTCSGFYVRAKTKKYLKSEFNRSKAINVFEGEEKGYYLFITRNNIQIELIENTNKTVKRIEDYLDFLFHDRYIGVSYEGKSSLKLKLHNVRCYYL